MAARAGDVGKKPFRILSLAGGGYLGYYTACVLAELEMHNGVPLGRRFDLIAGTSVGGILAVALAYEVPMAELVALFHSNGPQIFSARRLPGTRVGQLIDLTRSVLGPKYSGAALRALLTARLGTRTLADARHALVVPAVDVSRSLTKIFKTPHASASSGDEATLAVDVAMATCAAPAYFPSVAIDGAVYADGGLFAVAPDQVALHEAEHFIGVKPSHVRMLSIGTATVGYQPDAGIDADDGAVGWLSDGRFILTLVSVQQQHVQAMMEQRLGARYLHLDAPWPTGEGLGIDVATAAASRTLQELAKQTIERIEPERMRRLFRIAVAPA